MSGQDGDSKPDDTPWWVNWLSFSRDRKVDVGPKGTCVVVSVDDANTTLQLLQEPPCHELEVRYTRQLEITAAEDVVLPDDFVLRLVSHGDGGTSCDVRIPVPQIVCSQLLNNYPDAKSHLNLTDTAFVHIAEGNWAISNRWNHNHGPLELLTDNENRTSSIECNIQVRCLTSVGHHSYRCSLEPSCRVRIRAGSATFEHEISNAFIAGKGAVITHASLTHSRIALKGDLEVGGDIVDSRVAIRGSLVAHRRVSLEQHRLVCGDVVIDGSLRAHHRIRCDAMSVIGSIECDSHITAELISCKGNLTADQVNATTALVVEGQTTCPSISVGERMYLGNAVAENTEVTWLPLRHDAELCLQSEGTVLELLKIQPAFPPAATPRLYVPSSIEIKHLYVDIPQLHFNIAPTTDQRQIDERRSPRAVFGFHQRCEEPELRISGGRTRFRLFDDQVNIKFHIDHDALTAIDEAPTPQIDLKISGNGEALLGSENDRFDMDQLDAEGPIRLKLWTRVAQLTAVEAGVWLDSNIRDVEQRIPHIETSDNTVIENARGDCILSGITGSIRSLASDPLKIHHIYGGTANAPTGQLVNVDISQLPLGEIGQLRTLRVLEIEGRSLREFADGGSWLTKARRRFRDGGDVKTALSAAEIRTRSESLAELADIQSSKVNSGSSRAWLHWCVARLQHQGLERPSWERCFRSLYRLVGYGYRPGPALAVWMLAAALVLIYAWLVGPENAVIASTTLAEIAESPQPGGSNGPANEHIERDWSLINHYMSFLLLPITSLLRLGASEGVLQLRPTSVNVVARILIGIPFLFFLLSVRQFFRSPVTDKSA